MPLPTSSRSPHADASSGGSAGERPWLGINFVCANRYLRVFRDAGGSQYLARCPTCNKVVRFRVQEGGSSERFFEVDCR